MRRNASATYSGPIVTSQTYNLFATKEDRRSAHRQLKAYLRGDTFYRAVINVVKDDKVVTIKVPKLVTKTFHEKQ